MTLLANLRFLKREDSERPESSPRQRLTIRKEVFLKKKSSLNYNSSLKNKIGGIKCPE